MGEIFTVADLPGYSGWRETEEEKQAYERRRREIEEERERKRKAVVTEKQKQPAATNDWSTWYAAVDERVRGWFDYYFDDAYEHRGNDRRGCYFDMIAKGLADLRRQLRADFERALGGLREEFEAKLAALEQHLASNNQVVDGRFEAALIRERDVLTEARAEFKNAIEELCGASGAELAALEARLKAVPGKLPVAKNWRPETVTYQAEFVCHEGALWQACKDTAQAPGGLDWLCVARAGRDAVTPKTCGTFNVHKTYGRLDIVEYDGNGYLARRDAPGVPGISDGWQLVSRSGRRGATGEVGPRGRPGVRGERGEAAPTIASWTLDCKNYRAVPTMSNGTQGAVLDLRGLFEQFVLEVGYMGAGER